MKYKIIKEIKTGSGYIRINGVMTALQSLVPKVGDIIEAGPIKDTYIFNQNLTGIDYDLDPTQQDGAIFITSDKIKLVSEVTKAGFFGNKTALIGVAVIVILAALASKYLK